MFWLGLFLGNIMGIIATILWCVSIGMRSLSKYPKATLEEAAKMNIDELLGKDDENK